MFEDFSRSTVITSDQIIDDAVNAEYKHGFITDIETESAPPGLSEDIIRFISWKKDEPEFMLAWRLKAYQHWLTMAEPTWPKVHHPPIDYQSIIYYSAPKQKGDAPKSLDEVDPKLLEAYSKLGISLREQERLSGVAVDAVFDSVSVATTFKAQLGKQGIIFCSFSDAVREHPELVRKYLGSVVPYTDNFFASLNSAVFSDGSFCYIPKGGALPDGSGGSHASTGSAWRSWAVSSSVSTTTSRTSSSGSSSSSSARASWKRWSDSSPHCPKRGCTAGW